MNVMSFFFLMMGNVTQACSLTSSLGPYGCSVNVSSCKQISKQQGVGRGGLYESKFVWVYVLFICFFHFIVINNLCVVELFEIKKNHIYCTYWTITLLVCPSGIVVPSFPKAAEVLVLDSQLLRCVSESGW